MPDLVFFRANRNNPVKEGGSVTAQPMAIDATGVWATDRTGRDPVPSGQAVFAQTVLYTRFRNRGYYIGASGDPPDNTGVVIF